MVSIFFYCSSPYVGYTLKQADYTNNSMKDVSENDMTSIGYKLFNSSGSYLTLGKFNGRKYFHTRQSESENFDEQKRRIYTNVAFVGENVKDDEIINKVAMYVMFNEEIFYKEITNMISLLDDGFTVNFNALASFIDRITRAKIVLNSSDNKAINFYNDIMRCDNKELSFVVTESTWSYFIKQVDYDFNESVLYKLSKQEAEMIVEGSKIEFEEEKDSTNPPPPPRKPQVPEIKTIDKSESDKSGKKLLDQKDKEIEKLKQDINNLCAERNSLEADVNQLKKKIKELLRENTALKEKLNMPNIKSVLTGMIGTALVVLVILILKWIF